MPEPKGFDHFDSSLTATPKKSYPKSATRFEAAGAYPGKWWSDL